METERARSLRSGGRRGGGEEEEEEEAFLVAVCNLQRRESPLEVGEGEM